MSSIAASVNLRGTTALGIAEAARENARPCGSQRLDQSILLAVAVLLAAIFIAATAWAQSNFAIGMKLEDAGFKMREANSPDRMARLTSIPPHKFVPHVKNGVRYYVYADPTSCRCAYVGDQNAMRAYRDMTTPQGPTGLPGVGDIGRSTGGVNLEDEMQTEMNDESGTNFDDIFHPGF